jgi:hypothetical protein
LIVVASGTATGRALRRHPSGRRANMDNKIEPKRHR